LLLPAVNLDVVHLDNLTERTIFRHPGPLTYDFIANLGFPEHILKIAAKQQGALTPVSEECSNTPQPG
jgi:hypothetical protein